MKINDYFKADSIQREIRQIETDIKLVNKNCKDAFVIDRSLVGDKTFNQLKDLVLDYYNRRISELKEEFEKL